MPLARVAGLDILEEVVSVAHQTYDGIGFVCANAYHLPFPASYFDLVLAVEALEHIRLAEIALDEIGRVGRRYALVSVPQKPMWRIPNLIRGAYAKERGNTPGHLRHWSRRGIAALLRSKLSVEKTSAQFPWTMALCRIR